MAWSGRRLAVILRRQIRCQPRFSTWYARCRTQTVENIRERFVTEGFEVTLDGQPRLKPPCPKLLDGEQEAKLIAMRLGTPPPGFSNWTLRLLAEQVVALEIVESISYETVRRTLKKTG